MTKWRLKQILPIIIISIIGVFNYTFLKKNTLWAQNIPEKMAISHLQGESAFNYLTIKKDFKIDLNLQTVSKINLLSVSFIPIIFLFLLYIKTKKLTSILLFYFFYFINIDLLTRITTAPLVNEHIGSFLLILALITGNYALKDKNLKFYKIIFAFIAIGAITLWLIPTIFKIGTLLNSNLSSQTSLAGFLLSLQSEFHSMNLSVYAYLLESGFIFLVIYHWSKLFYLKTSEIDNKPLIYASYALLIISFYMQGFLILSIPLCLFLAIDNLYQQKFNLYKFRILATAFILILSFLNFRKFIRISTPVKIIKSHQEVKYIVDLLGNTQNNIVAADREIAPLVLLFNKGKTLIDSYYLNQKNKLDFYLTYQAYSKINQNEYYDLLKAKNVTHLLINQKLCAIFDPNIYSLNETSPFCSQSFKNSQYFQVIAQTPHYRVITLKVPQI